MARRLVVTIGVTTTTLAATAIAATALAACTSHAGANARKPGPASSPAASPAEPRALTRSYSANGATFDYPSSWQLSPYSWMSSFFYVIGYLSNQPLHDPCVRGFGSISCSSPLKRLGPGGVLVTWREGGMPGLRLDIQPGTPTTIRGHPARIAVSNADPNGTCGRVGATKEVDVSVRAATDSTADDLWQMTACLAGPNAQQSIDAALAVARSLRLER